MTPDYSPLFKNWRIDISDAPRDGTLFMGRITGTNRAVACAFQDGHWINMATNRKEIIEICQWISFTDFADIRSCVWRS